MIGICPNCGIKLKEPPFGNRETNEVVITLRYRDFLDKNKKINSIKIVGYCEVCNASLEAIKNQIELIKKN